MTLSEVSQLAKEVDGVLIRDLDFINLILVDLQGRNLQTDSVRLLGALEVSAQVNHWKLVHLCDWLLDSVIYHRVEVPWHSTLQSLGLRSVKSAVLIILTSGEAIHGLISHDALVEQGSPLGVLFQLLESKLTSHCFQIRKAVVFCILFSLLACSLTLDTC